MSSVGRQEAVKTLVPIPGHTPDDVYRARQTCPISFFLDTAVFNTQSLRHSWSLGMSWSV